METDTVGGGIVQVQFVKTLTVEIHITHVLFVRRTKWWIYWFTNLPFWDAKERLRLTVIETVQAIVFIAVYYNIFFAGQRV